MRCDHCAAEAVVVSPGTEAPRVLDLFVEARGVPMRCWCLDCARQAGWPWLESEVAKRNRRLPSARKSEGRPSQKDRPAG